MSPPLRQWNSLEEAKLPRQPVCLAIGMFDGVHLGHQAVIELATQSARRIDGAAAVLTFTPHPSRIFRPANPTRLIAPLWQKMVLLAANGISDAIVQPFDASFGAIDACDFANRLKRSIPQLAGVFVGDNFRFGKGRAGGVDTLLECFRPLNVQVFSAPRIRFDGDPISSTRIREELEMGRVNRANSMLGYAYFSVSIRKEGKRLARSIGFPTINLPWAPELTPKFGVYAVRAQLEGSDKWLPGVANYGLRPTVDASSDPLLEVHTFDPVNCEPGRAARVEWLRFIRTESRFESVDALKDQIRSDTADARRFFESRNEPTPPST